MSIIQVRGRWRPLVIAVMVLVFLWTIAVAWRDNRKPQDSYLQFQKYGLVSENGNLQPYLVESPGFSVDNSKDGKNAMRRRRLKQQQRLKQKQGRRISRLDEDNRKQSEEQLENYRKRRDERRKFKDTRQLEKEIPLLKDEFVDAYITDKEPENVLQSMSPKIRRAFLRKVAERKKQIQF